MPQRGAIKVAMSHKSTGVRYLMRKESWKAHTTMHAIRHHTPPQVYASVFHLIPKED